MTAALSGSLGPDLGHDDWISVVPRFQRYRGIENQARDVGQRRGLRPGRLSRLGARAEAHPAAAGRGVPGARAAAGAMGWRGG